MKIAIFTFSGEAAGLAYRLKQEGYDVLLAILDDEADLKTRVEKKGGKGEDPIDKERRLSIMDGLVEKMDAWEAVAMLKKVPEADRKGYFIFADMNHVWKPMEELQGIGFPGMFPTEEDRILEVDRKAGKQFVEEFYPDLKVAEVQQFSKVEEAVQFLEDTEDVWVLKGNDEDAETFVPESEDPEIARLELMHQMAEYGKDYEKSGFILERKIIGCMEITPEVTFWNGEPVYALVDIELKRQYAGNIGILSGCAADLVFEVPLDSEIINMILPDKVREIAEEHEGMFVWDASLLFDPETGDAYYGEFCSNRKGWNAFYTELAMLDSAGDYFERMAAGENPYAAKVGACAMSVRIFNNEVQDQGPERGKALPNIPLYFDEYMANDLWIMDGKAAEDENLEPERGGVVSAGYGHDLAVVTGTGDTLHEAARRCYLSLEGEHGTDVKGLTFEKKVYRPMHDILSTAYQGNIIDRYLYGVDQGLYPDVLGESEEPTDEID